MRSRGPAADNGHLHDAQVPGPVVPLALHRGRVDRRRHGHAGEPDPVEARGEARARRHHKGDGAVTAAKPEESKVALRCHELHRFLGRDEGRVHVLKGVSFEARAGQVYAIVGPSGCGKSTFLYLLGLLDLPDSGEIWINGRLMSNSEDAVRTAARGEHIGFVFQFHFLMLEFTVLENVMMPMKKLGRLSPGEMEERAARLLDSVGLGAKVNRLATHLSGGEQQRVAIARAL